MYALVNGREILGDILNIKYDDYGCVDFDVHSNGRTQHIRAVSECCVFSESKDSLVKIRDEKKLKFEAFAKQIKEESIRRASSQGVTYTIFQLAVLDLICHDIDMDDFQDEDPMWISPDDVIRTASGVSRYMECNGSMVDAYMDYMH